MLYTLHRSQKFLLFCSLLSFFYVQTLLADTKLPLVREHAAGDLGKHKANRQIIAKVMTEELALLPKGASDRERSIVIMQRLDKIAAKAVDHGLDLNAYSYVQVPNTPYLRFAVEGLWDGENSNLPLTLVIYAWPPKRYAQYCGGCCPDNCRYHSNIHGHPILCASTVLQGSIVEENFQCVKNDPFKAVRKVKAEVHRKGHVSVDDNSDPYVHRMTCGDPGSQAAITLHAYGAKSFDEVFRIFRKTLDQDSYLHVLQPDGTYQKQLW